MTSRAFKAVLAAAALLCGAVHAQDFPNRPIKWVVPFLPGTSPDLTVRIVAEGMAPLLKQPIVIENKPGAAGNLGAQQAARSPADGYTWVYSSSPMASSMVMYQKPGFDVMKDFTHIGHIAAADSLLVVNPALGINSLKELVEHAKKNPGKMSFASGGVGSPAHLSAEMILNAAGAEAVHVPFKGASESVNAVIGKQVEFAMVIFAVGQQHVQSGKLKALAVSGPKRNPRLPNVPTLMESGVPVTLISFGGLSVPAGTPKPITERIGAAFNQALKTPEVKAKLEALGSMPATSTPEEYAAMLKAEIDLTAKMMKAAKIEQQ
jgi:tripartite-type tricarboxylate transporter receptor subunit TctC